jgi:hypothetical protein
MKLVEIFQRFIDFMNSQKVKFIWLTMLGNFGQPEMHVLYGQYHLVYYAPKKIKPILFFQSLIKVTKNILPSQRVEKDAETEANAENGLNTSDNSVIANTPVDMETAVAIDTTVAMDANVTMDTTVAMDTTIAMDTTVGDEVSPLKTDSMEVNNVDTDDETEKKSFKLTWTEVMNKYYLDFNQFELVRIYFKML